MSQQPYDQAFVFILTLFQKQKIQEKGKKYFIPYALPSYTTFTKPKSEAKPLLIVWKEGPHGDVLPVPQGIFPLTISHLLNQEETKDSNPSITAEHFYKYRNAMSLRVTIEEQSHTLHIVNCYTHIEVYFIGPEEYRPDIRILLTKAIDKSADAMHIRCTYVNAFHCPNNKSCYCSVTNESSCVTNCILCLNQANIKDKSYWSWFITSSSTSSKLLNLLVLCRMLQCLGGLCVHFAILCIIFLKLRPTHTCMHIAFRKMFRFSHYHNCRMLMRMLHG